MGFEKRKTKLSKNVLLNQLLQWNFEDDLVAGHDEDMLTEIYQNYKEFFCSMKSDLHDVKSVSNQLEGIIESMADSSKHVTNATQYIAQGASSQAEDVIKCMTVADELAAKIATMDDRSKLIIQQALIMREHGDSGKQTVNNLSKNQEEIKNVVQAITDEIYILLDKTNIINEITQVLYGISKQTSLLSLNASIEAARAGEAGRGFAVVADEVRKLSEESKTASESISHSVSDINKVLSNLREIITESGKTFDTQKATVNEVVDSFETINQSVEVFVSSQKDFNQDFEDISQNKNLLLDAINNIASVIEESSATTDEVATLTLDQTNTSDLMKQMSHKLHAKVSNIDVAMEKISTSDLIQIKKKIAMVWDLDSPFWLPAEREAMKTSKILDYDIRIFAPKCRGEKGILEMVHILEEIRDNNYDGICISPITDQRVQKVMEQISKQGTKVIFILSTLDHVPYEALIGTNNINCGKHAADVVRKLLNDEGEVALIRWSNSKIESIEQRANGFIDGLKSSNIHIHEYVGPSEPTQTESEECIHELLAKYPHTKLLYATNVGWGLACARYVSKHQTDVKVVTVDYTDEIAEYMNSGCILAAIAQRPKAWGALTLEKLHEVFEGKTITKNIDTGTYEVNPTNMNIFS